MKQMFTIFSQRCGLFAGSIAFAVAVVTTPSLSAETKPKGSIIQPVLAEHGMVSAQEAAALREYGKHLFHCGFP